MHVRDWMTSKVISIGPDETVFEAKRVFHENGFRHLPVVEDGRLVGVVSHRDLLGASLHIAQTIEDATKYLAELRRAKVRHYMAHPPFFVGPDDPIEKAARVLRDQKIGCLPVVENGKLAGMLTETDLFDALVETLGLEAGESKMVFDFDDELPERTMQQIVEWLMDGGLSLTSLVTYRPRTDPDTMRVLVRAAPGARTSIL